MKDQNDDSPEAYGCVLLVDHEGSQVWIATKVKTQFDKFDEASREKLKAHMELWCEERPLTKEMFNGNEGRSKRGIMIKAFKNYQIRLYGFERQIAGIRTFPIVDCDPAKKRDDAKQTILKRAKKRADSFGKEKK